MIGARRAALPDRETFLEAWIALLRQGQSDQFGFDIEVRRLLFQAVRMHRGTDGLAELARRDGRRLPEAYRKWILALASSPIPAPQASALVIQMLPRRQRSSGQSEHRAPPRVVREPTATPVA